MSIRVFSVEMSAWEAGDLNHALLLGEYADEGEAVTDIWRDLVEKKQHRTYLLFRHHAWLKFWRKPVAIVWGTLHGGMPRIQQEPLGGPEKDTLLHWLRA